MPYPSPTNPIHVVHHNRGYGYGVAGVTGLMPAAIAANSLLFALYCAQQATIASSYQVRIFLERLRIAFTTIGAFTAPVNAGRSLGIYRATAGPGHVLPTVGTPLTVAKKATLAPASVASAIIANTAILTPGTVTIVGGPIAMIDLAGVGAAGNRQEMVFELAAPYNAEFEIAADELLVVSNPVAMDAAGTWQLSVDECQWTEQNLAAMT